MFPKLAAETTNARPLHPIHRRYYAEELVRLRRASEKRRYVAAQRRGRVDPNPHQIEAVMFALERIPQGGCILADEVGLGKTIEAGLVVAQLLAEGTSRVLIIVPRPLLGQWQAELRDLFGIDARDASDDNVDVAAAGVFIAGREFAGGERGFQRLQQAPPFELFLIDEAHEVFAGIHRRYDKEGVYNEASPHARTAHRVRALMGNGMAPVLLLTATPMQNSLDELWALVQYIDCTGTLLGDKPTFDQLFKASAGAEGSESNGAGVEQAAELQRRLQRVVKRTLRRQAMPYLDRPFVGRQAKLFAYRMSTAEKALYDDVTGYLLEPDLAAFSGRARQLQVIGFLRRMASSKAALAASLKGVAARLQRMRQGDAAEDAADLDDLEAEPDPAPTTDETTPVPASPPRPAAAQIAEELDRVQNFIRRAETLPDDTKAEGLVEVVRGLLDRPPDRRKVLIFTESLTTQDYLRDLLVEKTTLNEQDITLFRGVNDSPRATEALRVWREEEDAETPRHLRASLAVAVRLALVHEFRTRSTVMIATEAGAKGLNLQFCDTIVNYDLPWNPQRIEQRIGRCHRYGQQRDVTVINFLAEDNQAQVLTFDILSSKLDLFGKVLDMSDVVLQTPRSDSSAALASALGPDFQAQVRRIWERARTIDDVEAELRQLRDTLEERRRDLDRTRERTVGLIEQRLDASVRQVFDRIQKELAPALAELDGELKAVLCAYLDAQGIAWGESERAGHPLLHFGASSRLPEPFAEGGSVVLGGALGLAGADPLHVGHPLVQAAVASAREDCAGRYRVRFRLDATAPKALRTRRGSRGRLALTRIRYEGFEPEERLRVTAVFDDAEVLRPAEAALELLRQPCEDLAEPATPLEITEAHLDEVVDEELFEEQGRVADVNQQGFEQTMTQLEQYLADRALVLRREQRRQTRRLAAAERQRDQSVGADSRARAQKQVVEAEAEAEKIDAKLAALVNHEDEIYKKWKGHAHERRYATPTGERLLSAEFVIE